MTLVFSDLFLIAVVAILSHLPQKVFVSGNDDFRRDAAVDSHQKWLGDIRKCLRAEHRALYYFLRMSFRQDLSLDAVFGLRIARNHWRTLQTELSKHKQKSRKVPVDVHLAIAKVTKLSDVLISRGLLAICRSQNLQVREYFRNLGFVIKQDFSAHRLDHTPAMCLTSPPSRRPVNASVFDEAASDACFSSMLGTGPEHRHCTFEQRCVEMMLRPHGARAGGYKLTHQLLFTEVAVNSGCLKEFEQALRQESYAVNAMPRSKDTLPAMPCTVRELYDIACGNVWLEMRQSMTNFLTSTQATYIQKDLFLEQGALCLFVGYPGVLTREWLYEVLSWQERSGCVSQLDHSKRQGAHSNGDDRYWQPRTHTTRRRLLYDPESADGCSQHATGLLIAYLAGSVRYKMELYIGLHTQRNTEHYTAAEKCQIKSSYCESTAHIPQFPHNLFVGSALREIKQHAQVWMENLRHVLHTVLRSIPYLNWQH